MKFSITIVESVLPNIQKGNKVRLWCDPLNKDADYIVEDINHGLIKLKLAESE